MRMIGRQWSVGCGLWVRAALLLLVATLVPSAQAKDDFLRPDVAYRYTTRIDGDRMSGTFRFDETSAVGAPFRAQRIDSRPELFD